MRALASCTLRGDVNCRASSGRRAVCRAGFAWLIDPLLPVGVLCGHLHVGVYLAVAVRMGM